LKIAVVGLGYVGLSIATLLSQNNEVIALDIETEKVKMVNKRISPIKDKYIEKYFKTKKLNLKATLEYKEAFEGAEFIIICTPTNYDENKNYFDTSSIEEIIQKVISMKIDTTIVVKSTVPIGFVKDIKRKYKFKNITFSPEFLREGYALYDNLYPSRIIIGDKSEKAKKFVSLLQEASLKKDVAVKFMNSTEAEAVKLFANTYLAFRVAYFNELDTYAEINNLNAIDIIKGVSLDPRIGDFYNNPSFGYGGYCLPKDTKQLERNYKNIPENLISAIVESNSTRKKFIVETIKQKSVGVVGIYRLTMKENSDNFRESAVIDIIELLKLNHIKIVIYEPLLKRNVYNDCEVINEFELFIKKSNIVIANRWTEELKKYEHKVYSRDIYKH
jgi:nucleotide sugar dehydrogenase